METQNIGAAAVFVKTVGLSPLKTRLAKTVGKQFAHDFFLKSCRSVADVLLHESRLKSFWSVAEGKEAFKHWDLLPCMEQGTGDLGSRLDYVYSHLKNDFGFVALLGSDAPQLTNQAVADAIGKIKDFDFVIGPASDGGFYLFLGRKEIPRSIWTSVAYSQTDTFLELRQKLESIGTVFVISELTDVDEFADLTHVYRELGELPNPTRAQQDLLIWLSKQKLLA